MMFTFFLRTKVARKASRTVFRPCLEALEDRTLPSVIFPANNGFERPNLLSNGSGNYRYPLGGGAVTLASQGGSGWTFSGLAGVADNGSDPHGNSFNVVGATNGNHDGTRSNFGQAALIQNHINYIDFGISRISQDITFPESGKVSVTFSLELRGSLDNGNNPINVKFDNFDLGSYLALSASSFNTVTTPSVFLTGGTHTLSFAGTNISGGGSGDTTQFIDNVQINVADTDIDMQSAQLHAGNVVQYTYATAGNPGPFQVGFYQSADGMTYNASDSIGMQTVTPNPTNPQTPGSFTLPNPLPFGPDKPYVVVVADPNNAIAESNENNNAASALVVTDHLVVTAQPNNPNSASSQIVVGTPFDVKIAVEDANGNVDQNFTGQVTIAVNNSGANPGGGALGGTVTLPVTNGVADLNNLILDEPGTGYTLQVTSTTARSVTTNRFDVSVETATTVFSASNPAFIVDGIPPSVFFWATVLPNTAASEAPTGAVQFFVDFEKLGDNPVTLTGGTAFSELKTLDEGSHDVVAFFLNKDGAFTSSFGRLTENVFDLTTPSLEDFIVATLHNNIFAKTIDTVGAAIDTWVNVIDQLPPLPNPFTLRLNLLNGGISQGITVSLPSNLTLDISSPNGTTTFVGHSPALTVLSGNVVVSGVTFTNTTDTPTILVQGGKLVLRNDTIQESTGGTDSAIALTGGTLDLGTTDSPGSNLVNVNGTGEFVHNTSSNPVSASGNTFEVNGTAISAPTTIVVPTVLVTGGTFTYDGTGHPATGSIIGADGASIGTPTFHYTDSAGNTVAVLAQAGTYTVLASAAGSILYTSATNTATIVINKANPAFSLLSSPTVIVGTNSTTLSGKISLGSLVPTGNVTITLNGVSKSVAVKPDGTFSIPFATGTLGVGAYHISYSYGGDPNFTTATGDGTLNVTYNVTALFDQSQAKQAGSTIPILIQLTNANGTNLSPSAPAVTVLGIASVLSPSVVLPADAPGNSNPGNAFNSSGGRLQYNLKTSKTLAPGIYFLFFTIQGDLLVHSVQFEVK